MRKLICCLLCLGLLSGCVSLPAFLQKSDALQAVDIVVVPASAAPSPTPVVRPTDEPTATPVFTAAPTKTPKPTDTPAPTEAPIQTLTGGHYFRFEVPGTWLRAPVPGGVYLYPDPNDMEHTFLLYQEAANELQLTETSVDIALLFSSQEVITAMVEKALIDSGVTDFTLAPVSAEKTRLNSYTCYRGASTITRRGETYDFVGYIFLRWEKLVLLVWVGDQARYAQELDAVYSSLNALK